LKLTKIYASLSPYWDNTANNLLKKGDHPIDFDALYSVNTFKEHQELLTIKGPAIIVAGSGMCTGGNILSHLEHSLEDEINDVLFVGYQCKGTLGHQIQKYSKTSNGYAIINRNKYSINARVHVLSGYSAHADKDGLLDWVSAIEGKPKTIKLVHGDKKAQASLKQSLEKRGFKVR
jgi:metallo-beta-lactamase family protein